MNAHVRVGSSKTNRNDHRPLNVASWCNFESPMRKGISLLLASLLFFAFQRESQAEPKVSYLVQQLQTSDDFRVRTQAALALGASADDAAVKPLCDALADENAMVKQSAAAALGKLGKAAGLPCLTAAIAKETAAGPKKQMQKAIDALAGTAAPPPPGPGSKYYVAIEVTNKSKRPLDEVDSLVRSAMQSKLLGKTGYAVAPKGESSVDGGKIVKSKKLTGYYLIASVEPPVYDGGNLTQVVRVSMWSYPTKALKGEFTPKLTQSDTPKPDPEGEKTLIKMCVENAVDTFAKIVASL
jgi:HEAT repeats